jgi:glycosyltransferase involved in cell wall biosynthesis
VTTNPGALVISQQKRGFKLVVGKDLQLKTQPKAGDDGGRAVQVVVQQLVARYRAYMGNEAGTSVPRIEFLDASLHRDDIVALMDMCDVLVHPSRAEG